MTTTVWRCKGCTTVYRIQLHRCPRCTGTTFEEVQLMPKIRVEGGATNAADDASSAQVVEGAADTELVEVVVAERHATGELAEQTPAEPDYDPWTVADLKREISDRNEARADRGVELLPVTGNKADLVERLRADDAAAVVLFDDEPPVDLANANTDEQDSAEGDAR